MSTKLKEFQEKQKKAEIPEITTGDTVRITQKVNGKSQSFEGLVIAKNHGKNISSMITVRKVLEKVGVERIFPLHCPTIEKIEIVKKGKVRKSKIYYIKDKSKKVARKKIK